MTATFHGVELIRRGLAYAQMHKLTVNEIKTLLLMLDRAKSGSELAKELGVARTTASSVITRLNLKGVIKLHAVGNQGERYYVATVGD